MLKVLGVRGDNLPAKKTQSVVASDFAIGGVLLEAERMYDVPFEVSTPEEYAEIFGGNVDSTQYGGDFVKGFFDNVQGVSASLYVQTMPGYDTVGDAIDAVNASRDKVDDGADADAYVVKAAYEDNLQYGVSGNRIGTKFTQATRYTTAAANTAAATVYTIEVDSVIGIRVGDIIKIVLTGGVGATVYHTVTAIDESANTITWTDAQLDGAGTSTLALDDVVTVPGFTVQTYYKSINGVETEVDIELGQTICSSESSVTEFYVENVFKSSKYIQVTEQSASTLEDRLPADDASVTYPTNGAAGTAVASVEAQTYFLNKFDDKPVRFIANPETTDETMQKALVTYSLARTQDNPIVIINIASNRTKSQLLVIGHSFQRSDFYPAVIVANWLKVEDPYSNSPIAPDRSVPNVGHVMGAWIRTIGILGIHVIPATNQTILNGVNDVVGLQFLDDTDKTDIANAGVNLIQKKTGIGIKIANLFTPSTDTAYIFSNGILMRNFLKVSAQDSLSGSENEPNTFARIEANRMAMLTFMYSLWNSGSTGDVAEGETFGQGFDANNQPTVPTDHFEVIANATNNPQSSINLGERYIYVYFTYATPAGRIRIGVGILLR